MFTTLHKVSGATVVFIVILCGGVAFAESNIVRYGTTGNCPVDQVCTAAPLVFGLGLGEGGNGIPSTAPAPETQRGHHGHHGKPARFGQAPHHGGGMGGGGMGGGGMGGGGNEQ